jgi:hypothetical protein
MLSGGMVHNLIRRHGPQSAAGPADCSLKKFEKIINWMPCIALTRFTGLRHVVNI